MYYFALTFDEGQDVGSQDRVVVTAFQNAETAALVALGRFLTSADPMWCNPPVQSPPQSFSALSNPAEAAMMSASVSARAFSTLLYSLYVAAG